MSLPDPYYDDGQGIVIYHGDCRDLLPHLPPVDLVLTDPPYGLDFPYLGYDDTRANLKAIIEDIVPTLREMSGRMFVLCGPTQIALYPEADWVACVTWNTTGSFGAFGYAQWTPVLCYGSDLEGFGNVNGVTKSDVLRISGGGGVGFMRDGMDTAHSCPKPQTMMRRVVQRFTPEDCTILDPFMGSGTTLVAARDLGRKCIGIEIEEKYCEIAVDRLRQGVLFR